MREHGRLALSTAESLSRATRTRGVARRVVIVGNGMVSHGLCGTLTSQAHANLHVTVFGEEAYPAYDRVHLSEIHEPETALLAGESWYRERGIELRLGTRVTRIDRAKRHVLLEGGETVAYDSLVLATGAEPLRPELAGIDHPRVFSYRTIDDVHRIRAALDLAQRAVIVGGGLLGLEAARLSLDAGCATTVVETSRMLMPRQLDHASSDVLRARVEALGVNVRLGTALQAIEEDQGRLRLRFEDGSSLEANVVVVAVGVRPRDELARAAGLAVAARGGVIVDDNMRTADPAIYAIGDCACHRGRSYGLIAPGLAMADVVARVLLGRTARFARGDSSCELKLMGIPVAAVGSYEGAEHGSRSVSAVIPGSRRTLLLDGDRCVGAVAVGAWPELPRVRALAERGARLSRRRLEHFERTGRLFADDAAGIASWPAAAVVCNCRLVTKGELEACMRTCGPDAAVLSERTGAASVCGSCRPLLLELVGKQHVRVPVAYARALATLSVLAAIGALVLLLAPAPRFAASVQHAWHAVDRVRLDPLFRRVTGFTAVGFAVLSLVLSLRKRTRMLRRLPFGGARALHALLGGLALLGLLAHTGLRMGAHLNFALMATFLVAALIGGLAGTAAAAEGAVDPAWTRRGRTLRNPLSLAHLLVLWPLPVLLGLHMLAAYYF